MSAPHIPDFFSLEPYCLDDRVIIARIEVPDSLIAFCSGIYHGPNTEPAIIVAEFYGGEEYLIHFSEQKPEDRAELEALGWPPRLLDVFYQLNAGALPGTEPADYIRLHPA